MLRAVLLDVGGTLWPDVWPADDRRRARAVQRLRAAVPYLSGADARALVRSMAGTESNGLEQPTYAAVAAALRSVRPAVAVPPHALVDAICEPAAGRVDLYPGAADLLAALKARSIRVVIASNTIWRDAAAYRRDFSELGLEGLVDEFVTSLDAGWRKPHPQFFDAALRAAEAEPHECMMIGDSEGNDIAPARHLGMTTIRVAIEHDPESSTAADHRCRSLAEVLTVVSARSRPSGSPT